MHKFFSFNFPLRCANIFLYFARPPHKFSNDPSLNHFSSNCNLLNDGNKISYLLFIQKASWNTRQWLCLALLILVIPQVLFRSLQSPLENTKLAHFWEIILNGNTKYMYNKRCHAHFLSLVACGFEKRKMQLDTSSPIHDVPCKTSDCVLPECINSKIQTMKSNLDFKEANNQPFK